MNIVVGYPSGYDQWVTMQMVHPSGICFRDDNVFKLSLGTFCWAFIQPMNIGERYCLCFTGVPITRVLGFFSNARSHNNC